MFMHGYNCKKALKPCMYIYICHSLKTIENKSKNKVNNKMKCLCLIVFLAFVITQSYNDLEVEAASSDGFVSRKGVQFILNGEPFYANGFNAYWLMYEATDPNTRYKVTHALENAAGQGLAIARTWGFRDGGYRALQTNLGSYDEQTFQVYTSM